MPRKRSLNRSKALELYKQHSGNITPAEISNLLHENIKNIYAWKRIDEWDNKIKLKPGAPKGNKNALGTKGSGPPKGNKNAVKEKLHNKVGAPKGNLNALKHGLCVDENKRLPKEFIKKWFPTGLKNAYEESAEMGLSALDKLGHSIDMLWARILVSQKITSIKNKKDMTKELKRTKFSPGKFGDGEEEEYELQFAWDKENAALDSYSAAMEKLANMIEKYEKLLHVNWEAASEEQRLKVEKLKKEISKLSTDYDNIPVVIFGSDKLED